MSGSPTKTAEMAKTTETAMATAMGESSNINSNPSNAGSDFMFRLVFHHAPVGIAFVSLDGSILQVNPELCRFLGYPDEQLRTLTYHEITHPDFIPDSALLYGKLAGGELATARMEARFVRGDGTTVWGVLSVVPMLDANGKPTYFMSMITDITLRKRTQAELESARSGYGAILDNLDEAIIVCDPREMIVYSNRACRSLLGWASEEMLGANFYNFIYPDDRQMVQDSHESLSSGSDERSQVKCRVCREDGAWLEVKMRIVRGPAGEVTAIISVGHDAQRQDDIFASPALITGQLTLGLQYRENAEMIDPLTGLLNRRAGDDLLTARLASWRASAFPLGCLLVDIDNFKAMNDRYGQPMGDEALKMVASILAGSCRDDDFVARYQDDRFLVVLPATNAAGTIILGEKLVRNVREVDWASLGVKVSITISVGATGVPYGSGITPHQLMGILHAQTEQAKANGRDRMVMNTRQLAKEM